MSNDVIHFMEVPDQLSETGHEFRSGVRGVLPPPPQTVLLAEDSEDDIFMMERACLRSRIPHQLQIVPDGALAIDYISGRGAYADRMLYPMPSLIFLDINMPKQNGFEVLKVVRAKPEFKGVPVIMLSSSTLMRDVDRAYQLGVTSYLLKTPNQTDFEQAIQVILKYWLELCAP